MDHFTRDTLHPELIAITSLSTPDPANWAFSSLNDLVFDAHNLPAVGKADRGTPDEWISRGSDQIRETLSRDMKGTRMI